MIIFKPNRRPQEFGFKKGDTHLIVNAMARVAKAYSFEGNLLWQVSALADGQHPNWRNQSGDTPPGLYKLGALYNDFETVGRTPQYDRTLMAYGWQTYDMVDLEGNEDDSGRAGICIHGGGSGCGWPGAWSPRQKLLPTLGCVRMHNEDLLKLWPLYIQGQVFLSVYQDSV